MKKDKQLGSKLFALAEVDRKAVELTLQKRDLEGHRAALQKELERRNIIKLQCEADCQAKEKLRLQEEDLLAAEEMKILERRKQLQGIGGAKAAKIIERDVESTTKTLHTLEERVTGALQAIEEAQKKLELINVAVNELSEKIAAEEAEHGRQIKSIDEELGSIKKEREIFLKEVGKIDDRVLPLYERIRTRYPGDPVAVASGGSCRSCFRALPNQLFNLILAGNTRIQCPGCSRILVLGREDSSEKAA